MVTTSADRSWSDWPTGPTYLPFVQMALVHLLHSQTEGHNYVAGDRIRWQIPAEGEPHDRLAAEKIKTRYSLVLPTQKEDLLSPAQTVEGKRILDIPGQAQAGIYRVMIREEIQDEVGPAGGLEKQREPVSIPFAVVPDLRESENLESLTREKIDGLTGIKSIHMVADVEDEAKVFDGCRATQVGVDSVFSDPGLASRLWRIALCMVLRPGALISLPRP